jgi:hypothetical protein
MIRENHVFVIDMVVIDPTWEMVATSVISWSIGASMELNAIANICKCKKFHEGHHFILMAIEMHNTPAIATLDLGLWPKQGVARLQAKKEAGK